MNSEREQEQLTKEKQDASSIRDDVSDDLCHQLCIQVQETKYIQYITRTIISTITFLGLILYFYYHTKDVNGCHSLVIVIRSFCLVFSVILIARFPIGLILNIIRWRMSFITKIIQYHNILNNIELITIVASTLVMSYFAILDSGECQKLMSNILIYLVAAYFGLLVYGTYAYFMVMNEKEESQF